jgi:hypothetical protein
MRVRSALLEEARSLHKKSPDAGQVQHPTASAHLRTQSYDTGMSLRPQEANDWLRPDIAYKPDARNRGDLLTVVVC